MKFKKDKEYVTFYSKNILKNNKLFENQKIFIESQINSSKSLFSNWAGKDFKKNAREYLKKRGLLDEKKK